MSPCVVGAVERAAAPGGEDLLPSLGSGSSRGWFAASPKPHCGKGNVTLGIH